MADALGTYLAEARKHFVAARDRAYETAQRFPDTEFGRLCGELCRTLDRAIADIDRASSAE